jgi:iron(III) transport system ATP-binding protein
MSDRIAVMSEGRIVQEGTPRDIYERPATRFVANFVGTTNFLDGTVVRSGAGTVTLDTEVGGLVADAAGAWSAGDRVLVAVRPEAMRLHVGDRPTAVNVVAARVDRVMFVGETLDCHLEVRSRRWLMRQDPHLAPQVGDHVWVELPRDGLSVIAD